MARPYAEASIPSSHFAAWEAERERLFVIADAIEEDERSMPIYREAFAYNDRIVEAPCDSRDAVLGKLRWLRHIVDVGESGKEGVVIDQIITYLSRG